MTFIITKEDHGICVRDFLHRHLSLSTKMLKFLKYREDGILLNGRRVTVRHVLQEGDSLALAIADEESSEVITPIDLPLEILYEDNELVVPSKPAGMPTHPSHNHHTDTVANALAYRYQMQGIPFVFRPVNRLDKDTSGLLLIAKNKLSAGLLTKSMQENRIHKTYLAVLEGEVAVNEGVIEKPLHRTAASIIVREVCPPNAPDAEPSKTVFYVLARQNGCSLVQAHPITGRTHQLRVHFASIGHPIAGDTLYGIENRRIARQALHARTLSFPHPTSGEEMTFTAPLPPDLQALINKLFPNIPLP